ncbi:MAG TPA: DMT family transporter [Planctomycetota bacterium]|nr:DMT family transporter [Planctomycetota bacterium]
MDAGRRATVYLLGTTVFWGSSFLTMKWGAEALAPATGSAGAPAAFLFLRFSVALAVHGLVFRGSWRRLDLPALRGGVALAMPFYLGFILQTTGVVETSSTVSAFLTSLMVVLTPVLGLLFFKERLTPPLLAGVAVSIVGVYFLTAPEGGIGTGEWLTLLCAVAFAVQIQLTNVVTRRHEPEAVTTVMFACAVVFSGALLAFHGVTPAALLEGLRAPRALWTVVYTAVFCSVVAIWVLNRYQREISPTRAAVLYMLEPLFAAVFGATAGGERLPGRALAGGAIILAGNLLCEWGAIHLARRRSKVRKDG